jgi:rhamnosyltransferase
MINKCPRFIVLMAAYNGIAYISAQINSILNQKDVNLKLFISVDLSKDQTYDFVHELALLDERVFVLPYGQRFGGAGPNFYRLICDVDFSDADYVSFADQDDIWHPNKLIRAYQIMHRSYAQGYSTNLTAFWPNGIRRPIKKSYPQRRWDFIFESAGPGCTYVLGPKLALALKQFVFQAEEGLSTVEFHDWLIYAYARFHGSRWVIDDWSSIEYRQHLNNQLGVNSGVRSFMLRVKKILNGYGVSQSLLIANLIGANSINIVRHGLLNGRMGYLWLALRCCDCRRKKIDRMMFFISCLLLAIINPLRLIKIK